MKFLKFLPHCIIIGLLAMSVQYIQQFANGQYFVGWIVFQAWALYFLAGCTVAGGKKSFAGWICGIVAACLIIILGLKLGVEKGNLLGFNGFPVAVFVISFSVILFEKVKGLDFIPAWFVAAGAVFAFSNVEKDLLTNALTVLISGTTGLLYGYLTILFRGIYSKLFEASEAASEEAPDAVAAAE